MNWVELSVETPPEFVEPLTQAFSERGHEGVVVEQPAGHNPDEGESPPVPDRVIVRTYVPRDSETEARRHRIDVIVRLVSHFADISPLQVRDIGEDEWQQAWKEHFHVLHVGRRIVIAPTWRTYRPRPSDVVVTLDPGMAFGTGHHPTTRMCLELLEDLVRPGQRILDVGCGSGILSIASARLGATSVLGLEIDATAAKAGQENVLHNGVGDRVRLLEGTLPHKEVPSGSYDVALANISAKVVIDLAESLATSVRPGGTVVASGVLAERRDSVTSRLSEVGLESVQVDADGDWLALVATKS